MWSTIPRNAKNVIVFSVLWFVSLFITAIWDNKWTTFLFYLCLMGVVLSALIPTFLIPTFRLPWASMYHQKFNEQKTFMGRLKMSFVLAMCILGVLMIFVLWLAHVYLLFK